MQKVIYVVALCAMCAYATIINVPLDQSTIQAGIDVAISGDTVLVDTGTYSENIDFTGKNITVASHFIYTQDMSTILNTVISGTLDGPVVLIASGEDTTAVIEGFLIRDGHGNNGDGIFCEAQSNPLIQNNFIVYNMPSADGGGIFMAGESAPTILNNFISYNTTTTWGGGIYVFDGSSPYISRNVLIGNGVAGSSSPPSIGYQDNERGTKIFIGGRVYSGKDISYPRISNGGGILATNYTGLPTSPTIINNSIHQNVVVNNGGGIFCNLATPDIRNNIITENTRYGIYAQGNSIEVTYNDVWNSTVSNYNGNVIVGTGNISDDPMYVAAWMDDLHLQWGSPCIDTGDPASPLDPDNTRADMGAFYYDQTSIAENRTRQVKNSPVVQTIINGPLHVPAGMHYTIFDVTGRQVGINEMAQGVYIIEFEGKIQQKIIKIR